MRCTEWVHLWVARELKPGETAIDATAGNGHDTVFLARAVGEAGRVFAFDAQARAIAETSRRLGEHGLAGRAALHHQPHERMDACLPPELRGKIGAVLFNLGFLPGAPKETITRAETTVAALGLALDWLRPGGLVTVVAYPGHEGGAEEAAAVRAWAGGLDAGRFDTMEFRPLNRGETAPFGIALWQRKPPPD